MNDDAHHSRFHELLRQVQAGSEEAARELYETYVKYVLICVRRRLWQKLRSQFDSQDFVQQVWASFFAERERLPTFESPEALTAYLIGMTRNKVLEAARRRTTKKSHFELELGIEEDCPVAGLNPASRDPTPSAVAVRNERYDHLMMFQPSAVKEVADLRIDGNSYPEIAEQMEIDAATARKAMRHLKRWWWRQPREGMKDDRW